VYWVDYATPTNGGSVNVQPSGLVNQAFVLASGQSFPNGIAVDDTSVYWTNSAKDGGVMKINVGGGTPEALADNLGQPFGIAVDDTSVYWTNQDDGTVRKVPLDGGAQVTLATGQAKPYLIALDATCVYWTNALGGTVRKVAK
jgi:hypothetical protein